MESSWDRTGPDRVGSGSAGITLVPGTQAVSTSPYPATAER